MGPRQARDPSLTEETADLLAETICALVDDALRESWAVRISATEDSVRLVAFADPRNGMARWAVVRCYQGLWHIRDTTCRVEAEQEYEATVRRLTYESGYRWAATDVPGACAATPWDTPRHRRRAGLRPPTRTRSR
ncbi:hypothetical protein [Streptacidiphilus sp. EB129]|uniref:hypothetical protein n=1 Tax=Streptacidiphilus sp. EB129 TaxID=3156262 RepID=UPI00351549B9